MSNQSNRVFGNSEHPQFPDLIKAGLKVGDKVYSYLYGDGVVTRFTKNEKLPIVVTIRGFDMLFMSDGRRSTLDLIPSMHLQPWNPIAGEPFPFHKWEPIVGEVYAFWDTTNYYFAVSIFKGIDSKGEYISKLGEHYRNCAPISEAMRIFGFDKIGEVEP
jgi:hypothetical protein